LYLSSLKSSSSYNEKLSSGGVYQLLGQAGKNPANGLSCYACGDLFSAVVKPSVDHLIPVSHRPGGRKLKTNNTNFLALMCMACNRAKSAMPFLEYSRCYPQVTQGLIKQASILKKDPRLVGIANEQLALAEKARRASKWTILA